MCYTGGDNNLNNGFNNPTYHKQLIKDYLEVIPVMAKARIGHIVEAQILEALGIDYIDESEVLTPADDQFWSVPPGEPGAKELFDDATYDRGAAALQALREKIGDQAFFTVLRRWTTENAGGNVTTADFVALAEQVSGQSLDAFFDTWIYRPGRPARW